MTELSLVKAREKEHYHDLMKFTGLSDQFLGRRYRCEKCGKYYWSAWGWARRHYEKHVKEGRGL